MSNTNDNAPCPPTILKGVHYAFPEQTKKMETRTALGREIEHLRKCVREQNETIELLRKQIANQNYLESNMCMTSGRCPPL